jgi:hypothetical protein
MVVFTLAMAAAALVVIPTSGPVAAQKKGTKLSLNLQSGFSKKGLFGGKAHIVLLRATLDDKGGGKGKLILVEPTPWNSTCSATR